MKILFNHEIKNSLELLNKFKELKIISEIFESNMEDTWNFKFNEIDFYLQLDRNSLSNSMIYNYTCESIAINNCEGTQADKNATLLLLEKIKTLISDFTLDDNE